jgi:hypothetical protein
VTEKVTLKLTAAAAVYVRSTAPKAEKMKAARGEIPFCADNLGTVLFFLSHDPDAEVKAAAVATAREMPDELLAVIAGSPETHPKVLDLFARLHADNRVILEKILSHPAVEDRTVDFLATRGVIVPEHPVADLSCNDPDLGNPEDKEVVAANESEEEDIQAESGGVDEASVEFQSKYKISMHLGISEKIKFALSGDKEWRTILIRDSNKLVSSAVIRNPRITDAEILTIAKSKLQNEEIVRLICMNKEWLKIYPIRKALVENSKTPLPKAIRFLSSLTVKDLSALAKSRNVQTVISTQARRLLSAKRKD